jgi:hypothetical protein
VIAGSNIPLLALEAARAICDAAISDENKKEVNRFRSRYAPRIQIQ